MSDNKQRVVDRLGLERGKEMTCDYPDRFTVVGVDISEKALLALYKGNDRACEIIRAAVDKTRTANAPPQWFINSLRGGVHEPILLVDLGPDKDGKSWAVVDNGRQRVLGLRIVNDENAANNIPRLKMDAKFKTIGKKDAGLTAALVKATSNVSVAMTPSQRADHAASLESMGVGVTDIMAAIGARDEQEVKMLLALAKLDPSAQQAVDDGTVPIALATTLEAFPPAEQKRRIERKTSGGKGNAAPTKAQQDAAAPPRAKGRPAALASGMLDAYPEASGPIKAILGFFSGDNAALDSYPSLKEAAAKAGWKGAT